MEKKIIYMQNEDFEEEIKRLLDSAETEEVEDLIKDMEITVPPLEDRTIQDIKNRVAEKTGLHFSQGTENTPYDKRQDSHPMNAEQAEKVNGIKDKQDKRGIKPRVLQYKVLVPAAAILLFIIILGNGNNLVQAVNRMFGLIPGVGIVENNQDILYCLDRPVSVKNKDGILNIQSAVATKNSITVQFSFNRPNLSSEQQILEKKKEEEDKINIRELPEVTLIVNGNQYSQTGGSAGGGGMEEHFTYTYSLGNNEIRVSDTFSLDYSKYNIKGDFRLIALEQHNSLEELGATEIHNNISLTAVPVKEGNQLKVNVYPVNYSKYRLISFDYEYNLEYFGKKIILQTDKGKKGYTLPGSYGSGMSVPYTFQLEAGTKDYTLKVPFIVVESDEKEPVTLPIPKNGETISLDKKIELDGGYAIIKSVKKVVETGGNKYGDLRVELAYEDKEVNKRLVRINLTREDSEGWSEETDDQGRLTAINYMLEKSDKNKLKLKIVKPWYVLMDEYNLNLKPSGQ